MCLRCFLKFSKNKSTSRAHGCRYPGQKTIGFFLLSHFGNQKLYPVLRKLVLIRTTFAILPVFILRHDRTITIQLFIQKLHFA